ncbi:hypothetical protein F9948_20735 [Burkholderia thailandensis]|nr:hypothetical protein [Burkholderia thailandensis]MDD1486521.1 hypothetical protein [Burkholderia thailandensis]MDD1492297.1 hypothetical protein [Burkholderia thailandensis]TGB31080.1 hypothetical protein C6946_25015 [Burkholderia thailandensis]
MHATNGRAAKPATEKRPADTPPDRIRVRACRTARGGKRAAQHEMHRAIGEPRMSCGRTNARANEAADAARDSNRFKWRDRAACVIQTPASINSDTAWFGSTPQ